MPTQEKLKAFVESGVTRIGKDKAVPVIRSMYPSKSRSEMSREFAQCAIEGANLLMPLLIEAMEALDFYLQYSKKTRVHEVATNALAKINKALEGETK